MKFNSQRMVLYTCIAFFAYGLLTLWRDLTDNGFVMMKFIGFVLLALALIILIGNSIWSSLKRMRKR